MKYGIFGKTGKQVQIYKTADKAAEVMKQLEGTGAILEVLQDAKPRRVRNAGKTKNYHRSTLRKILLIIQRGQDKPRFALYVEGILVAYTKTEDDAIYLQRKARGFSRRVLSRKFSFRIEKLVSAVRQAVA